MTYRGFRFALAEQGGLCEVVSCTSLEAARAADRLLSRQMQLTWATVEADGLRFCSVEVCCDEADFERGLMYFRGYIAPPPPFSTLSVVS